MPRLGRPLNRRNDSVKSFNPLPLSAPVQKICLRALFGSLGSIHRTAPFSGSRTGQFAIPFGIAFLPAIGCFLTSTRDSTDPSAGAPTLCL
jgi:hypothetical protein